MTKFEFLVLKGLIAIISMNILIIKSYNTGVLPDFVTKGAKEINEEIAQEIINGKDEYGSID